MLLPQVVVQMRKPVKESSGAVQSAFDLGGARLNEWKSVFNSAMAAAGGAAPAGAAAARPAAAAKAEAQPPAPHAPAPQAHRAREHHVPVQRDRAPAADKQSHAADKAAAANQPPEVTYASACIGPLRSTGDKQRDEALRVLTTLIVPHYPYTPWELAQVRYFDII